ncbi:MAG: bifunctional diaminohydroxyphosphoribosylaminopyrimidine deaminase/5-amino-6-(5-phosphoribosylamino)uracil reductase RibD [Deltaproteobacteria bacterium]|nr:MAG: bifunctional diaminohydroxyphosphoribosylaminopyrimidine deaminase/5-amino-6-(5-phosphoribosylamino)uracil reductase RibD [Deltaproteobacteria bacterium]
MAREDEHFMRIALRLAARGVGHTSPNPMVGAVVVKDGELLGKGYHQEAGGPHAEIHALQRASTRARGACLYVTLEPCNHHGRTPPCTEAIIRSGVTRVVIGCSDPNPRVAGGGAGFLRSGGIRVEVGVLEEKCRRLNEPFIKHVTTGLPLVVAKVAASLDGKIASYRGDSQWISNERSRRFVHRLRHELDAIAVGVGTVIADNPRLTSRLPRQKVRNPLRIILDTNLRTPPESQVVGDTGEAPTLIATGPAPSRSRKDALEQLGVEILVLPLERGRVALSALLRELGNRGITSLLVEGGAEVHGAFFYENLVDKVYIFFAPKIIGGSDAVPMVGGTGVPTVAEASNLKQVRLRRLDDDIMVEGYLQESALFSGCLDQTS